MTVTPLQLEGEGGRDVLSDPMLDRQKLEHFLHNWDRHRADFQRSFETHLVHQDTMVRELLKQLQCQSPRADAGASPQADAGAKSPRSPKAKAPGPSRSDSQLSEKTPESPSALQRKNSVGYHYVTDKKELIHHQMDDGTSSFVRLLHWMNGLEEPERKGWLAWFINTRGFNAGTQIVIMLTTLYTVLVVNHQVQTFEEDLGSVESIGVTLALLYILEVALRVMVHRGYFFVNEDMGWNIFDFMLASSECWSLISEVAEKSAGLKVTFLRSLRVLRITRLLRIFKTVNALEVLRLLLEAMIGSLSTVMWCALVIIFALAISALMFVQLVADFMMAPGNPCNNMELLQQADGPCEVSRRLLESFGSVTQAMLTLFMANSGGQDWQLYYMDLKYLGWGASSAFVAFTFFFQFGLFNLLTSMFVDRAMRASKPDIDMMIVEQRTRELEEATRLKEQLKKCDENGDGRLSMVEFQEMLHDKAMSSFLAAAGLEIQDAEMFFRAMVEAAGDEEVPVDMFVQGCMRMKGTASSIDMQTLTLEVRLLSEGLKHLRAAVDRQGAQGEGSQAHAGMEVPMLRPALDVGRRRGKSKEKGGTQSGQSEGRLML